MARIGPGPNAQALFALTRCAGHGGPINQVFVGVHSIYLREARQLLGDLTAVLVPTISLDAVRYVTDPRTIGRPGTSRPKKSFPNGYTAEAWNKGNAVGITIRRAVQ